MIKFLFLILSFLSSFYCFAETFTVNSQTTFDSALSSASDGDFIQWSSGTYSDIFMNITKSNITVEAANIGEVIFDGASRVNINADNVTFSGFQYIGGDIATNNVVNIYGTNILFTEVNIIDYTSYKYLIIEDESQYTTVSYCNFENRINTPDQNILSILVSDAQAGFHKVQYCSFKNFEGENTDGDAGVEPIRIGVSTTATYESKSIIEYCYFTQCNGDGEIISHKATQCVYRYNTFENNPHGELVLRHGNTGIVYGNFFLGNLGGIRVREGSDHLIYNNYFEDITEEPIQLQDSDEAVKVENIIIAYNTLINNQRVRLSDNGSDTSEVIPSNITLINNIFSDSKSSNGLFENATGNETWFGNLADDILGITTPSSGITIVDPQLNLNAEGYYEIASTSPAIDASEGDSLSLFPFATYTDLDYDNEVLLDITSATRDTSNTLKDIGSQEYNATGSVQPYVDADNTGPIYLTPGYVPLSNNDFIAALGSDVKIYPNPLTGNQINISFNFTTIADVEVILYNIVGQKVQSIMNNTLSIGAHNLTKNIDTISAGVYLVQIKANNSVKTEKFIKL